MDQVSELVDDTSNPTESATDGEAGSGEAPPPMSSDAADRLDRIVESVLFASGGPISFRKLLEILDGPAAADVQASLARLKELYAPGLRGIQLQEVAGGFQLRTARENAEWVRALFREKPTRLGRATLETLAVIAYRQPVTKADIELIRGVDVDGTLTTLLTRKLIKIAGRKDAIGRPLLYATSSDFLETFGLKDLKDLPSLRELGPGPDADYTEITDPQSENPSTAAPAATEVDASGEARETPSPGEVREITAAGESGDAIPTQEVGDVGEVGAAGWTDAPGESIDADPSRQTQPTDAPGTIGDWSAAGDAGEADATRESGAAAALGNADPTRKSGETFAAGQILDAVPLGSADEIRETAAAGQIDAAPAPDETGAAEATGSPSGTEGHADLAAAEDPESNGDHLETSRGRDDSSGAREGEWQGSEGVGDEGKSPKRSDHD